MHTPVIQTPRLILRPLALTDAPAIQRHFNNWNIIKNLASVVPWPYPDDGAETFVRLQLENFFPRAKRYISGFWCCGPVMEKPSEISTSGHRRKIQKATVAFGLRSHTGIRD